MKSSIDIPYAKYCHIFYCNETKFSVPLIMAINKCHFEGEKCDHIYVTAFYDLYKELSCFENVFYIKSKNPRDAVLINYLAEKCDYVIIHNFFDLKTIFRVRKKNYSKIVWRAWGSDIPHFSIKKNKPFRNACVKLYKKHMVSMVNNFALIGVANIIDTIALKRIGITNQQLKMPYRYIEINECEIESESNTSYKLHRVLLGHSSFRNDNHIEMLKRLSSYPNKLEIIIPLSYGDSVYKNEIVQFINNNDINNEVKILDTFLSYEEYNQLIKSLNIAVFDGLDSYALGNVSLCLNYNVKVYLNKQGIIKEAFDLLNIPCCTTDTLGSISFDELTTPAKYDVASVNQLSTLKGIASFKYLWEEIFNYLDKR